MYHGKRIGGDRIEVFKPAMRTRKSDRLTLETDLRRALERDEMTVLYQPIVWLEDRSVAGFEALLRWDHPKMGRLSPADFIPLAEETGLIVDLGLFVLDRATRQLAAWQRATRLRYPLFCSVNISSRQLLRHDLIQDLRTVLSRSAVARGTLKLELTESLVMENPEYAAQMLTRMRELGVGLSLDDFGTGHSSLAYLQRFPFDTIKIDQSFVRTNGKGSRPVILRSIIAMAHDLSMDVIAEGAETRLRCGRSSTRSAASTRRASCSASRCTPEQAIGLVGHTQAKRRGTSRRGRRRCHSGRGRSREPGIHIPKRAMSLGLSHLLPVIMDSGLDASRRPGMTQSLRVPGFARQLAEIDADLAHRLFVFAVDVGAEDQFGVGVAIEPAVLGDLVLELPRRPARIAEREHRALRTLAVRDRLQDIERRGEADAVVDRQGRVLDEEIGRVQHEAAPGLDRPALEHLHGAGLARQAGSGRAAGMTSSCTSRSGNLMLLAGWLTTMPIAPSEECAQT